MAALSAGGVNALFSLAFGRPATASELKYWSGKEKTSLTGALKKSGGLKKDFLVAYGSSTKTKDEWKAHYAAQDAKKTAGGGTSSDPTKWPDGTPKVTGNEAGDKLLNTLVTKVDDLVKAGNTVNPAITITPEQTAAWLAQAKTELDPYYAGEIDKSIAAFKTYADREKQTALQNEQDTVGKYSRDLWSTGENLSESGWGSSSKRMTEEDLLAKEAQKTVDRNRELAVFNTQGQANLAAADVGGGTFNTKAGDYSFGARPLFTAGKAGVGLGANTPLYSISPSVASRLENEKTVKMRERAADLQSAFVGNRAFNFS